MDPEKLEHMTSSRMPLVAALEVLAGLRRDEIVITTMGAAREWPRLSQHPLDFHYIPSAMGEAPALALGLALALPSREVIVLNGDGCMLMNLGVAGDDRRQRSAKPDAIRVQQWHLRSHRRPAHRRGTGRRSG